MKDTHTITIIRPTGEINIVTCNKKSQYDLLVAAVGGYIETVPYFTRYFNQRCIAYVNEEGKLHGLPFNPYARAKWLECFKDHSKLDMQRTFLNGNLAIVTKGINFAPVTVVDSVHENDPYGMIEERKKNP